MVPVYAKLLGGLGVLGGKNKTAQQIAHLEKPAFLVKDDILAASPRIIPLPFLGFIY